MCSLPMGMGSAYIPPHAISASSEMNDQNSPNASRITQDTNDGDKGWRPQDSTPNEWLQVYFGTRSKITGIATKGIKDQQLWVKWYQIEYGMDGNTFQPYTSDNSGSTPMVCLSMLVYPINIIEKRIFHLTFKKINHLQGRFILSTFKNKLSITFSFCL